MRIRLIKKLAPRLNGVDLSNIKLGECADVPHSTARMLVQEGWAELDDADSARDHLEMKAAAVRTKP